MSVGIASKRDPFPYDARIDGLGVILQPNKDGDFVSRRVQPLQAQPTSYEYSSNSPFAGATSEFRHLVFGAGEHFQPSGTPRRYKKAEKLDASINGRWIKGPRFHAENVNPGSNPVRGFIRGLRAGSDTLFAMSGNRVCYRNADNDWQILAGSAASGSGYWTQAAQFTYAGSTNKIIYFAQSAGNLAFFDSIGAGFQIMSGVQGPNGHLASSVEVINKEMWVGYNNFVEKVEADPVTTANWAAAIRIGDASANINWLRQNKNALYIFKENGVYTFGATGIGQELYPSLRNRKSISNGVNAQVWMDDLYVPFSDTFFKIAPDGTFKAVGMEQMLDVDEDLFGFVTAFAGHNTWFGYEPIYSERDATTYLMKYGTWIESEDNRTNDILQHIDVHHGAIASWAGKRATACEVIQMPGTNDRLYIGFDNGTAEWCWLPKNSPNPVVDQLCEFTSSDSYMYAPDFHGGFAADRKIFQGFSAFGPNLDANDWMEIEYRLGNAGAWTNLSTTTPQFTVSGQRIDFADDSNIITRTIQYRAVLKNGGATTHTPVLDGVAVHYRVRPQFILAHELTVQAYNNLPKKDGTIEFRSAKYIHDWILNACGKAGTIRIVLPEEEEQEITIEDYQATLKARLSRYGPAEWDITIRGVQFKSLSSEDSAETLGQLTYGQMELYTYGQLESLL